MKRVKFEITISVTADVALDNIVNDLDYDVSFNEEEAIIIDTEMTGWN